MKLKIGLFVLLASLMVAHTSSAAQTYEIDGSHASIGFTIDHLVISKVRGEFREFQGTLNLDDEGNLSKVSSSITVNSIDTGIEGRDNHLKGNDFFNVNEFPEITFTSKSIKNNGSAKVIVGDLTIHGVTKEVELPFEVKGPVKGLMGKTRIGFQASVVINRADYGLTWNKAMEAGGVVVGEEVNLEINLEAIQTQG